MATKTVNYNLTKPSGTDLYDINVQNGNMDIIDTELSSQKRLIDGITLTSLGVIYSETEPEVVEGAIWLQPV